jgi:two-component system, NtrC family, sensor kinase
MEANPYPTLLPALRGLLEGIRQKKRVDDVVQSVLEHACVTANASHGSFVLVDHESKRLSIANVFGLDWTEEKKSCQLSIGEGLTGTVAATGIPILCADTREHPAFYPLFDYVRSEIVVPVVVKDRVWGVINIDGPEPDAFDQTTLQLLIVFAELTAFAITLRQEADEQDRLQQKLLQSDKLASLGEAIAGIAHEINNPLSSILGYASLLEIGLDPAKTADGIEVIKSEALRAAALIKGLLEFSRKETGKRERVEINQIVRKAAGLKKFHLKANQVKLEVKYGDDPCPVTACSQQIQQVILNLITNAEQALGPDRLDGLIRVSAQREGDRAVIEVGDNGPGIPPETQKLIFDPFFTTKGPGQGTGLGLSIAHSITDAHGGSIRLMESTPSGTVFRVELPLADSTDEATLPPRKPSAKKIRFAGRVLLVDDEPHILETLATYLQIRQVDSERAPDGQVAAEILRVRSFDVVISDVRMPRMDGLQLYEAARQIDPRYERHFVFMSGYLMSEKVRAFISKTGTTCLGKPFSFEDLDAALAPFLTRKAN